MIEQPPISIVANMSSSLIAIILSKERGLVTSNNLRKQTHQTPFELVSFVGRSSVRASNFKGERSCVD